MTTEEDPPWPADSAKPSNASSPAPAPSPESAPPSSWDAQLERQTQALEHLCEILASLSQQLAFLVELAIEEEETKEADEPSYLSQRRWKRT